MSLSCKQAASGSDEHCSVHLRLVKGLVHWDLKIQLQHMGLGSQSLIETTGSQCGVHKSGYQVKPQ